MTDRYLTDLTWYLFFCFSFRRLNILNLSREGFQQLSPVVLLLTQLTTTRCPFWKGAGYGGYQLVDTTFNVLHGTAVSLHTSSRVSCHGWEHDGEVPWTAGAWRSVHGQYVDVLGVVKRGRTRMETGRVKGRRWCTMGETEPDWGFRWEKQEVSTRRRPSVPWYFCQKLQILFTMEIVRWYHSRTYM